MRKHALIFAATMAVVAGVAACKGKANAVTTDDAASPIASVEPKATATVSPKFLPPDPPAPLAGKYDAGALSTMSGIVAAHPILKDIWEPSQRASLNALLTALSAVVETLQPDGSSMLGLETMNKVKALKLEPAFLALEPRISVDGRLPDEFSDAFRKHLASLKDKPHLGTWKAPEKPGAPLHDFTALAAWVNREEPAYLREHIAARSKGGTAEWTDATEFWHPWLGQEDKALGWLAMQTAARGEALTPAERARLRALASPLGALFRRYDCSSGAEIVDITGYTPCKDALVIDHRTNAQRIQKRVLVICKKTVDDDEAGEQLVKAGCKRGGAQKGRGIDFCCPPILEE